MNKLPTQPRERWWVVLVVDNHFEQRAAADFHEAIGEAERLRGPGQLVILNREEWGRPQWDGSWTFSPFFAAFNHTAADARWLTTAYISSNDGGPWGKGCIPVYETLFKFDPVEELLNQRTTK